MLTHEDHKYPICAGMPRMSIDLIPLASEKILLCLQYTPSWFALTCSLCNEIAACLIELHWPGLLSGCSFHDILVSLYRPTGADNAISSGIKLCDWFGSVRIRQLTKPLLYSVVGQPEDSWSLSIVCTVLNACTGPQTSVGGPCKINHKVVFDWYERGRIEAPFFCSAHIFCSPNVSWKNCQQYGTNSQPAPNHREESNQQTVNLAMLYRSISGVGTGHPSQ